jgi:hypothetical protein
LEKTSLSVPDSDRYPWTMVDLEVLEEKTL